MIRQVFPKMWFFEAHWDGIRSYLVVLIQTKNLLVFIQSTKFFCWCLTIMRWFNAVDKKTPAMPDSDSSDAEILLSMSMVKLAIDSPETCIEGIWIWRARAWKLLMFQKLPDLVCTSSHISIHFDCTLADGFRSLCQHPGLIFVGTKPARLSFAASSDLPKDLPLIDPSRSKDPKRIHDPNHQPANQPQTQPNLT